MCPAKVAQGIRGTSTLRTTSSEPPDLSDECVGRVDADRGEVLAEAAGRDRPTELALPPLLVLAGVGIDRLLGSTVVLAVPDLVADDAAAQPATLRPGSRTSTRAPSGNRPLSIAVVGPLAYGRVTPVPTLMDITCGRLTG